MKNRNSYIVIIIIVIVLILDQWTKIWVKTNMSLGEEILPFGGDNEWFRIHFTENPGMAFGLKLGGSWGKILLSSFRIVAVSFMGYYLVHLIKKKASLGLVVSIAFILAGAVGNILDSAFYGFLFDKGTTLNAETGYWNGYYGISEYGGNYAGFLQGCVVDMLYFPMYDGYFPDWLPFWGGEPFSFFRPVFNLADSSITLGVLMIIAFQRRFFQEELEGDESEEQSESQSESENMTSTELDDEDMSSIEKN